jgi:hypothetical protein
MTTKKGREKNKQKNPKRQNQKQWIFSLLLGNHAPSPLYCRVFLGGVHIFPRPNHDPPTYVSCMAEMTGLHHHI